MSWPNINLLIVIYLIIVLLIVILDLVTIYHFIKYRYAGDASLIIVTVFVIINIVLIILPFFFLDLRGGSNQIIIPII